MYGHSRVFRKSHNTHVHAQGHTLTHTYTQLKVFKLGDQETSQTWQLWLLMCDRFSAEILFQWPDIIDYDNLTLPTTTQANALRPTTPLHISYPLGYQLCQCTVRLHWITQWQMNYCTQAVWEITKAAKRCWVLPMPRCYCIRNHQEIQSCWVTNGCTFVIIYTFLVCDHNTIKFKGIWT